MVKSLRFSLSLLIIFSSLISLSDDSIYGPSNTEFFTNHHEDLLNPDRMFAILHGTVWQPVYHDFDATEITISFKRLIKDLIVVFERSKGRAKVTWECPVLAKPLLSQSRNKKDSSISFKLDCLDTIDFVKFAKYDSKKGNSVMQLNYNFRELNIISQEKIRSN